jgi:tetratricopeptide (TPR) repeat protein
MTAALLALVLGALDPCATVEPAPEPDRGAARLYRETGEAELAAGSRETAIAAFRSAAALDPEDGVSRAALGRLCREPGAPGAAGAFAEGIRRMDDGDLRGAAALFEPLRRAGDASAALLEGICRLELGETEESVALLRQAERVPAHRDIARFYLGVAALRTGDGDEAARLFDQASESPTLAPVAAELGWLAHRDGRFVLSLQARTGYDSNVALAPDQPAGASATTAAGDGFYGLSAAALWRPRGPDGPYLRAAGLLDQNMQLTAYDLGSAEAAAGWRFAPGEGRGLSGEAGGLFERFGGAPYLSAATLRGSAWATTGAVVWNVSYLARFESYATEWDAFSGVLQRVEGKATWLLGARGWLAVGYAVSRDAAQLDITSWLQQGPMAELRLVLGPRWWVGLAAQANLRTYDAYDATLGARREDRTLEGAAFLDWALTPSWTARLGLDARRTLSNVAGFEYARVAPTIALGWVFGP